MPSVVNINMINTNQLSSNSTIASGENAQFGWSSHQKRTYNLYTVGPFDVAPCNLNIIFDMDFADVPVFDPDVMGGGAV